MIQSRPFHSSIRLLLNALFGIRDNNDNEGISFGAPFTCKRITCKNDCISVKYARALQKRLVFMCFCSN